jgi:hypothetical protein
MPPGSGKGQKYRDGISADFLMVGEHDLVKSNGLKKSVSLALFFYMVINHPVTKLFIDMGNMLHPLSKEVPRPVPFAGHNRFRPHLVAYHQHACFV